MASPSPNPTSQVQALADEAAKHGRTSRVLKYSAIGVSSAMGLLALVVVLLLRASGARKLSVVALLAAGAGSAWGAWALHRHFAKKAIEKKVAKMLKDAGISTAQATSIVEKVVEAPPAV